MSDAPSHPDRYPLVAFLERRSGRQWILAAVVGALVVAWRSAPALAGQLLDRWWYARVTDVDVWSTRIWAQAQLAVVATTVTACVLGSSVAAVLALDGTCDHRRAAVLGRGRDRLGPAFRWILVGGALFLTIRIGAAATGHWQTWLLAREGSDLGREIPYAGGDLGTYLFDLPLRVVVSSWIRQLLLVAALASLAGHVATGAIRTKRGTTSSPVAIAHVGLLAGLLLAAEAVHLVLVTRPQLAISSFGAFDGAGWTDVRFTRHALVVVALAAVAVAALVIRATGRGKVRAPAIAVTALGALYVVAIAVVPAVLDRVIVAPAEADRQLPYIAANLDATRTAFGLGAVTTSHRSLDRAPTGPLDEAETAAIERTPLFDTPSLPTALQVLQGTTATRTVDVDVDRYAPDTGEAAPFFVSARVPDRNSLPETGWVQEHLVYTHGDGVVAVPADQTDDDGRPGTVVTGASAGEAEATPLYVGDGFGTGYVVSPSRRDEQNGARFDGGTGIALDSSWRRGVAAVALGDAELLLTSELEDESELLIRRDLRSRLHALTPFLAFDGDPYPVVLDGDVSWIVDGYTTSTTYPYAQRIRPASIPATSDLAGRTVDSLRHAATAVVDGRTGEVHVYRVEPVGDDPILDVWDRVFPGLLEPADAMPARLVPHLRYPTDLILAQSELLGRYHVDDAELLFSGTDRWRVSSAAAATVGETDTTVAAPVFGFATDDGSGHWMSTRPFSPGSVGNATSNRDELTALFVADHDDRAARLVVLDPPEGAQLPSPQVAQGVIDADPELARVITLLNANGSKVRFGPMSPLLVGDSVVWVRPMLVSGTSSAAVPRLFSVVAVADGLVAQGDDVADAVDAVLALAG